MRVKFGTKEGTFGPLLRAKFYPHRCNVLPLRAKSLKIGPWVTWIPARCAMLPVMNILYVDYDLLVTQNFRLVPHTVQMFALSISFAVLVLCCLQVVGQICPTFRGLKEFGIIAALWTNARQHVSSTAYVLLLTGSQATLSRPAGSGHQPQCFLEQKTSLTISFIWVSVTCYCLLGQPLNILRLHL